MGPVYLYSSFSFFLYTLTKQKYEQLEFQMLNQPAVRVEHDYLTHRTSSEPLVALPDSFYFIGQFSFACWNLF